MATIGTQSSAGTTVAIASGAPATWNAAGFAAQTFENIGKLKNVGSFGKQFSLISSEYLSQRGTEKRKGTFNAGSLDLTVDVNGDAGQVLLETALDSDADFSFRVEFQDGTTYYVRGQVTEFMKNVGGPNNMIEASVKVELNPILDGVTELAALKVDAP